MQGLLFGGYCSLEVLRVAYRLWQPTLSLIPVGILALTIDLISPSSSSLRISKQFKRQSSRFVAIAYLLSLSALCLVVAITEIDNPSFLSVQILFLAVLWLVPDRVDNRLGSIIQRISMIFTIPYVSLLLTTSKNLMLGYVTAFYVLSWLYMQVVPDLRREPEASQDLNQCSNNGKR